MYDTIRYDTIEEINVDSKAEYTDVTLGPQRPTALAPDDWFHIAIALFPTSVGSCFP